MSGVRVARRADLLAALKAGEPHVEVTAPIEGLPCLELTHGQTLSGGGAASVLSFGGGGLMLHGANRLHSLHLACPPEASAISLAPGAQTCGWFDLDGITCRGVVHLLFGDDAGHVDLTLRRITLLAADATGRLPRPTGNGVEVLHGALTVWNRAALPTRITLDASDIAIGSAQEPVRGTGLFVAGNQSGGGTVVLRRMGCGPVFSHSTLPDGTTGTVAGGAFFLAGVSGDLVECSGDVTTWGANAVPIDTWGDLGHWRVAGDARSHGPSAVGMVNAGTLQSCTIAGVIETFGDGARGCCVYGPTGTITATAIRTHGKAATGLQVVDRLEAMILSEGIHTAGEPGQGLMKGQMIATPAHGVEVEPGGRLDRLDAGRIVVTGALALPIHAPPGAIGTVTDQR
jgi:hypothetical protein